MADSDSDDAPPVAVSLASGRAAAEEQEAARASRTRLRSRQAQKQQQSKQQQLIREDLKNTHGLESGGFLPAELLSQLGNGRLMGSGGAHADATEEHHHPDDDQWPQQPKQRQQQKKRRRSDEPVGEDEWEGRRSGLPKVVSKANHVQFALLPEHAANHSGLAPVRREPLAFVQQASPYYPPLPHPLPPPPTTLLPPP